MRTISATTLAALESQKRKEYNHKYYMKNREQLNEKHKEYYQIHKEEVKEYQKKHEEEIKAYHKEYYRRKVCGICGG